MVRGTNNGTRVNIGCGMTPTIGWENFDNSFSLKLSNFPKISILLFKLHLLNAGQMNYITFCQKNKISVADATRNIPLPNESVEVVYSSHMLEHLDRKEVVIFLKEASRILEAGGIIRLAVPDISIAVDEYLKNKDADEFIDKTYMGLMRPRGFMERLRMLLVGTRHHHWMYDGKSLSKLLQENGFIESTVLAAGETTILNPGALNLREYEGWSVYVEAKKPNVTQRQI